MALGDLRDQINGAIDFIKGTNDGLSYPADLIGKGGIQEIKSENWIKKFPYSFRMIDSDAAKFWLEKDGFTRDQGAWIQAKDFGSFRLQLAPEELSQDEIFAINVTATQSGTVSEHNGIVFRDLTISGTTGVHPRRGTGGANNKGKVVFGSPSLRSGYDEFHELRNYFRAYAESKRQGNAKMQLLFDNQKDNELLIVEPQKFSLKRSASKATLYNYSITFKVIGNYKIEDSKAMDLFDTIDSVMDQVQDLIFQARGIILKSLDILRGIETAIDQLILGPLRQLDLALTELINAPKQLSHMSDNLINKFSQSATLKLLGGAAKIAASIAILGPVAGATIVASSAASKVGLGTDSVTLPLNIAKAATLGGIVLMALGPIALTQIPLSPADMSEDMKQTFAKETTAALAMTIGDMTALRDNAANLANTAATLFNLGSAEYNDLIGAPNPPIDDTKIATVDETELLYGFALLDEAINMILSTGEPLVPVNQAQELDRINEFFGSELQLTNVVTVQEIKIAANMTLETIAVQYLQDPNRWIDIVNLNGLKAPYISENPIFSGNGYVKKVGDTLLIPGTGAPSNQKTISQNLYNQNASELEKSMGVDLRLSDTFDLVMDTSNDFLLSAGGSNLKQGLRIKLTLQKGDLMYHPQIGVGIIVGEKTPASPNTILGEIEDVILSDVRVQKINELQLAIVSNAISIKLRVNAAENGAQIPLELTL